MIVHSRQRRPDDDDGVPATTSRAGTTLRPLPDTWRDTSGVLRGRSPRRRTSIRRSWVSAAVRRAA
jgi:hypothetical protein